MPLLAGIEILIQFCFAYHVLKTGRPHWWVFIIMSFPVMGCLIYYFVEVFPGSKEHRSAHKTARKFAKALKPDADLKRRAEDLELCGSVDNRMAMAEECIHHQMYAEAEKLYESCLSGAFASDVAILFGLARSAVENRSWDKAADAVSRIRAINAKFHPHELRLLEARIQAGQGQTDSALAIYNELAPVFVGLEARYRYAALLNELGEREQAIRVLDELVNASRRFASSQEDEQRWASAARQALASLGAGK